MNQSQMLEIQMQFGKSKDQVRSQWIEHDLATAYEKEIIEHGPAVLHEQVLIDGQLAP